METGCLDCPVRADVVLVDFAVFLCSDCQQRISTEGTIFQFQRIGEGFDRNTSAILAKGGNARFNTFWSDYQTLSDRFHGKRAEYYRRMLQAEASDQPFLELDPAVANRPATFSEGITRTCTQTLSWLEGKFMPLLTRLDQKLSNTEALKLTGRMLETGYQIYEAEVREHIIDRSGILHPLKEGVDMLDKAMDRPAGEREVELLPLKEEELPKEPQEKAVDLKASEE